ncbi:YitT family protein [Lysinibacillus sp. NPDC093210]|uniref:YczE/YyaS/YitT family protein n=1 Tax=Lysinibacillus sp. NPDC093210 TaxID=3364133 RepID=UPI0038291FBC
MNHQIKTLKRIILYVLGLFFMSIGISLSIQAGFGVSPVSSLAYASTLTTGLSVGVTMALANVLYIIIQVIISKRMELTEFAGQFIISFLFGFLMDAALSVVQLFPTPETFFTRIVFLISSLFVIAIGLMGYTTAKLPLMPYDALTYAISEKFNIKFGKAKISIDFINICVAGAICVIFIHSLGSIGIGTLIAAYFIGKILGWLLPKYQPTLQQWVFKAEKTSQVMIQEEGNVKL